MAGAFPERPVRACPYRTEAVASGLGRRGEIAPGPVGFLPEGLLDSLLGIASIVVVTLLLGPGAGALLLGILFLVDLGIDALATAQANMASPSAFVTVGGPQTEAVGSWSTTSASAHRPRRNSACPARMSASINTSTAPAAAAAVDALASVAAPSSMRPVII